MNDTIGVKYPELILKMFQKQIYLWLTLSILLIFCSTSFADKKAKKYSREANEPHFDQVKAESYDPDFRTLQRPFRMAKLNLVWSKAQNVSLNMITTHFKV